MKLKHEIDGYSAGSSGYRHGCRCDICKASNSRYQRKHRADDDTSSAATPANPEPIIEPVKEQAAAVSTPVVKPATITQEEKPVTATPVVAMAVRDESIPFEIIEALTYQDMVSYTDGGEGWQLQELALILPSMANVNCEIYNNELYVTPIAVTETVREMPSPITMTITTPNSNSGPAKPRMVPKTPAAIPAKPRNVSRASAPTVPGTSYRAPVSTTRNANTIEPFSL